MGGDGDDDLKRVIAERDTAVERFRLMARATNDGMWDWDMTRNTAWWSEAMYTVFGMPRTAQPSYEHWSKCVHADDRERVLRGFQAAVETGQATWSDEYRYVRSDGTILDVFDRGYVMFDEHGKPVRMVGVIMDITKQRALERQLRQSQKMEALGQLAGGIAHDFNNVLQAVKLELALLHSSADDHAKVRGHAEEIRSALDRAASLTRQLLVFSRLEAMRPQLVDLNAKLGEVARMLRRVLGEQIMLELDFASGSLRSEVDPSMLDQIVLNLTVNARDAMRGGGRLSIATCLQDVTERPGHAPGRYVCIAVSDTGTGIARDVLPRIFDPFFSTKQSSGLGLAIAHGIVMQHRGWIDVESEVGRGSTFRVYLPAHDGTVASGTSAPPTEELRGTERILVVEDDGAVRRAMIAVLEEQGYHVVEADCGPAALATWDAREGAFDLVVTDLVMPGGLNGKELAALFVARRPDIKIIIATGHGRDLDKATLGPNYDLLYKPVEAQRLLGAVRASLAKQ